MVANVLDTLLLFQIVQKFFDIVGGTVRATASNMGTYRHQQIKGSQGLPELRGMTPAQQFTQLKNRKLLSVNPLGSGGVGKRSLIFVGSRSGYVK